jgi:hypothetical protein
MIDRDYDPNNSNDDSNDDSNYDITYNNLSDYQPKSERGQRLDIRNTLKVVKDESKTLEEIKQIEYKSLFFRKDIVNAFQAQIKNMNSIIDNGFKLYNIDDLLTFVMRNATAKTRNAKDYDEPTKNFLIEKIISILVDKDICKSEINPNYLNSALTKGINVNKYDIVIISDTSFENRVHSDTTEEKRDFKTHTMDELLKDRLKGVVGFIIVELGECNMYPYAYSINLICGSGTGSILMGLYLYTIISHPEKMDRNPIVLPKNGNGKLTTIINSDGILTEVFSTNDRLIPISQIGVLELAGAYTNPGGLCMYEKFGFTYEHTMSNNNCFGDVMNLPMILNMNVKYTASIDGNKKNIVDITLGKHKGFDKSNICSVKDDPQKVLGQLKNTRIYLVKGLPTDHHNRLKLFEINLYEIFYGNINIINDIINCFEKPSSSCLELIRQLVSSFTFKDIIQPYKKRIIIDMDKDKFTKIIVSFFSSASASAASASAASAAASASPSAAAGPPMRKRPCGPDGICGYIGSFFGGKKTIRKNNKRINRTKKYKNKNKNKNKNKTR